MGLHAVVMDFEVEVFFAEDVGELADAFFGFVFAVGEEEFVDFAVDAAAEADEAFAVSGEGFFIDAGFVPHAIEVAFGDEFGEVFEAGVIGGEEGEVGGAFAAGDFLFVVHREGGEVGLTADDGVDDGGLFFVLSFCLGLLVKLDSTEEITVIGHGDRGHAEFGDAVHQFVDPHRAIQERVFGMEVEVDKGV